MLHDMVTLVHGKPRGFLSTKEFAESVGVKQTTVRVWILRKKLDAIKVGNEWFIRVGTPYPAKRLRTRKKSNKE